tara:strand:+ start:2797 stop:3375 length:579 start_codon:yes stop_codon:yes gene_type:complete
MKNIFLVLFFISCILKAQGPTDSSVNQPKKEFRINLPMLIINQTLCLIYEKNIYSNKSYGFSGIVNLSGDGMIHNHGWFEIMSLKSFYRLYINTKEQPKGFFTNIFGRIVYGENDNQRQNIIDSYNDPVGNNFSINRNKDNFLDVAIGADFGQKWVIKKKWTLQFYLGFGQFLFDRDKDTLLKGGITIGKFF